MSTSKDCVEWTLEWTLDAEESEMRPIFFRHSLLKTKTGLRPLALYVNMSSLTGGTRSDTQEVGIGGCDLDGKKSQ